MKDKYPSLAYLEDLASRPWLKFYNLEIPIALLEELGNPQDKLKIVHVGGTNGKGSTCALIASMLHAQGYKVSQFPSPHLMDICERCLINGQPISAETFDKALGQVIEASKKLSLIHI